MTLLYIPTAKDVTPMPMHSGEAQAVRRQAANLLRAARARGEKPRHAGPRNLWRLASGLLQISF